MKLLEKDPRSHNAVTSSTFFSYELLSNSPYLKVVSGIEKRK